MNAPPSPQVIDQLQAYLRDSAAQRYSHIAVPPFTVFVNPTSNLIYFNYAIPDAPTNDSIESALATLRATFAEHQRLPRFEFIEEFAPQLAPALRSNGFEEESRTQLMICTRATWQAAPEVPNLQIVMLSTDAQFDDLFENLLTNERGFNTQAQPPTPEDVERFRAGLATSRAFTARLDGQAVAAGMFTGPINGMSEVVGITTLEPFRRRGIAATLTATITAAAFDHGVDLAMLSAADTRAGHVYERVGFRPVGTTLAYRQPQTVDD